MKTTMVRLISVRLRDFHFSWVLLRANSVVWALPGNARDEIAMRDYPSYGFIMIGCQIVDFVVP